MNQQPIFDGIRAILIGRFQASVDITRTKLQKIVDGNTRLNGVPIVANSTPVTPTRF